MSDAGFVPNLPPKRIPTVTLVASAPIVGRDIADVTRFPCGAPVPSLGMQQHQVLAQSQALAIHE